MLEPQEIPKTLEGLVELVLGHHEQWFKDMHPAERAHVDRVAASAADDLEGDFGLDLDDPETARVVMAAVLRIVNRARVEARVVCPHNAFEGAALLQAFTDACNGTVQAVVERHRKVGS